MAISDKLLWALSDEAKLTLKELENKGIDRDLAITLLEALCAEEQLYDLPRDGAEDGNE